MGDPAGNCVTLPWVHVFKENGKFLGFTFSFFPSNGDLISFFIFSLLLSSFLFFILFYFLHFLSFSFFFFISLSCSPFISCLISCPLMLSLLLILLFSEVKMNSWYNKWEEVKLCVHVWMCYSRGSYQPGMAIFLRLSLFPRNLTSRLGDASHFCRADKSCLSLQTAVTSYQCRQGSKNTSRRRYQRWERLHRGRVVRGVAAGGTGRFDSERACGVTAGILTWAHRRAGFLRCREYSEV